MRTFKSVVTLAVLSLIPLAQASAAPIQPKQDRAGVLRQYQALTPADRQATIEAFTGRKISGSTFNTMDACTLRQGTEANAGSARLATTLAGCAKEAGL
ncbi:hypothetical protein GCM10007301_20300 [Azorhizobium oxalatiphilum]|uniref:Uncharacterized protein n=1 Tax=Azorhizobium oxalatiphilum TaxID=980631 RepID=A0A917F9T7_9HYPH|nr:hypothetical protein [Azorhizobium oxalatiphilum]GGF60502.1 hypothetical protein GCM10007301_20300 [Azorhizobium oxalatiphilum]